MRTLNSTLSMLPHIPGLDYYGDCQPAGDVGGDFFDFVPDRTNDLVMTVGDVSGHDREAAMLMSFVQTLLHSLAAQPHGAISEVVHELNRAVCRVSPDHFFVTLFCAAFDPRSRELHYTSAGHEPALLVRNHGGRAIRLESTGTVLGLTTRAVYGQRRIGLEPGDVLVAFTDGVTEATDSQGRELRDIGILQVVREYPYASSTELVGRIMDAAGRFAGQAPPADDRTVAVVRFMGPADARIGAEAAEMAFAAA